MKPPKDNKKQQEKVCLKKRGYCASQKYSDNGDDDKD